MQVIEGIDSWNIWRSQRQCTIRPLLYPKGLRLEVHMSDVALYAEVLVKAIIVSRLDLNLQNLLRIIFN